MGIRDEKNVFSAGVVERIEKCLSEEFGDIFHTGDNFNTLTFEVGEFGGKELLGSVKFTLHKESYNLDDEIEVFEDFYEMRMKKLLEKKKKEAEKEAKEEAEA
jgi:hypothetical protein